MRQPKAQIMGSLQLKALTFPEVSEVLKAEGTSIVCLRSTRVLSVHTRLNHFLSVEFSSLCDCICFNYKDGGLV